MPGAKLCLWPWLGAGFVRISLGCLVRQRLPIGTSNTIRASLHAGSIQDPQVAPTMGNPWCHETAPDQTTHSFSAQGPSAPSAPLAASVLAARHLRCRAAALHSLQVPSPHLQPHWCLVRVWPWVRMRSNATARPLTAQSHSHSTCGRAAAACCLRSALVQAVKGHAGLRQHRCGQEISPEF